MFTETRQCRKRKGSKATVDLNKLKAGLQRL